MILGFVVAALAAIALAARFPNVAVKLAGVRSVHAAPARSATSRAVQLRWQRSRVRTFRFDLTALGSVTAFKLVTVRGRHSAPCGLRHPRLRLRFPTQNQALINHRRGNALALQRCEARARLQGQEACHENVIDRVPIVLAFFMDANSIDAQSASHVVLTRGATVDLAEWSGGPLLQPEEGGKRVCLCD